MHVGVVGALFRIIVLTAGNAAVSFLQISKCTNLRSLRGIYRHCSQELLVPFLCDCTAQKTCIASITTIFFKNVLCLRENIDTKN